MHPSPSWEPTRSDDTGEVLPGPVREPEDGLLRVDAQLGEPELHAPDGAQLGSYRRGGGAAPTSRGRPCLLTRGRPFTAGTKRGSGPTRLPCGPDRSPPHNRIDRSRLLRVSRAACRFRCPGHHLRDGSTSLGASPLRRTRQARTGRRDKDGSMSTPLRARASPRRLRPRCTAAGRCTFRIQGSRGPRRRGDRPLQRLAAGCRWSYKKVRAGNLRWDTPTYSLLPPEVEACTRGLWASIRSRARSRAVSHRPAPDLHRLAYRRSVRGNTPVSRNPNNIHKEHPAARPHSLHHRCRRNGGTLARLCRLSQRAFEVRKYLFLSRGPERTIQSDISRPPQLVCIPRPPPAWERNGDRPARRRTSPPRTPEQQRSNKARQAAPVAKETNGRSGRGPRVRPGEGWLWPDTPLRRRGSG